MQKTSKNSFKNYQGQIMLMVILTMAGIFTTAMSISLSITKELRVLTQVTDSVKAFYAADAGIEWKFYTYLIFPAAEAPALLNGSSCCGADDIQISTPTNPGESISIRSIGISPASGIPYTIKRSIETNTSW